MIQDGLSITEKIKEDYGTVTFFCKKHNLNIHTFRQITYGYGTSKKNTDLLKKYKCNIL